MTVPGCVDGWSKLHEKFGKLPWKDLFPPAIYYAENGFPVTEIIHDAWNDEMAKLAERCRTRRRVYLQERRRRRSSARSSAIRSWARRCELIAAQGAAAFYKGAIAKAILEDQRAARRQADGRGPERVRERNG